MFVYCFLWFVIGWVGFIVGFFGCFVGLGQLVELFGFGAIWLILLLGLGFLVIDCDCFDCVA